MTREFVDSPGQRRGSRVTTSEKNGNDLIVENLAVAGEACQSVKEGIPGVSLGLGFELGGAEAESEVDILVDEVVDDNHALVERPTRDDGIQRAGTGNHILHPLRLTKSFGKLVDRCAEGLYILSKEEIGSGVQSKAEEEVADV